jgi:hypothetical protein
MRVSGIARRRAPLIGDYRRRAALVACGIATAALLGGPAVASAAAQAPTATTLSATQVQAVSATLRGSINPHGLETSYYFQYGTTTRYGAQTALGNAGKGTSTVTVGIPVTGLASNTKYHFRVVALSGGGASAGHDQTFTTKKIPLSLAIVGSPNPVPYSGDVLVQGTLSGTGNGERGVVLQANPFPYVQGFINVGNAELTTATGSFSFPVLGLTAATEYRVVTTSAPTVISPVLLEGVAVRTTVHVAHTARRHYVRFFGTVTPAEDGMEVGILKVTHGRDVLVAGTLLRSRNATSSRFSRTVHVGPGVYRVLFRITDGAHSSVYSEPLRVR